MVDHNQLKMGQVVYYCKRNRYDYSYNVAYGLVDDIWSDKVALKLLCAKDLRLINGIPYNEFKTPTHWQKLPKGWTYNTELFKQDWKTEGGLNAYRVDDPDEILAFYNKGLLIDADKKDWSHIEAEIDSKLGWRLIRKYDSSEDPRFHSTFYYHELFYTFNEAQKWIDDYNAELKRQAALSDEEWSLEQIEHEVSRYIGFYYADEPIRNEKKQKIMEWFKAFKDIEDVECRLFGGVLQWKYWENKRWNDIDPHLL